MPLRFSGHELDLDRQELRRGDAPVHVEPQVFDLLVHLIRNRDRMVSKEELIEAVWGGRIISEAALSSRINAARRAIGDTGEAQALIRTMPKRGFRFVATVEEPDMAIAASATAVASPPPNTPVVPAGPGGQGARPSIAVLPFANLAQDQDAEYLSYGLTEDIIRLLARYRWLTVLSRHSTFPFRGHDAPPADVGRALGARYLVQGSVRRRDWRMRITVDLVRAEDGTQQWSESFDHAVQDLVAVRDGMAQAIVAVIEPELALLERERAAHRPPQPDNAWDFYQHGLWHLWALTAPRFAEAEAMFRRAIALEPGLARAHASLAYVKLQQAMLGPEDRPARMAEAMQLSRQAVALDDRDCLNHCVLGRVHTLYRDHPAAVAALEQSIALNGCFAQAYFALGHTLLWCGRAEESITLAERAAELSPRDAHRWSFNTVRALAHLILGELDAAAEDCRQAAQHPNASHRVRANLVATLGLLGAIGQARDAAADLCARRPGFSIAMARDDLFFCADEDFLARYAEGLRRAGVPEVS